MAKAVKAYKLHKDWILAVAWSPTSAHHLVTASQDTTLKLWDVRTAVPLHTIEGHTDKVRLHSARSPEIPSPCVGDPTSTEIQGVCCQCHWLYIG
jgi:WD40 repeat protein